MFQFLIGIINQHLWAKSMGYLNVSIPHRYYKSLLTFPNDEYSSMFQFLIGIINPGQADCRAESRMFQFLIGIINRDE